MGLLQNGQWVDKWYDTKSSGGSFQRQDAGFRNWVTPDGSPGPSGEGGFEAEAGRYHLYVSHACPWANRTMIFRSLKGLTDAIDVSVVDWFMGENGWEFTIPDKRPPGAVQTDDVDIGDRLFGSDYMHQIYTRAKPDYSGRVTVPVLWDKQRETIVSNESSEIIRMFNSGFGDLAEGPDYYPEDLREEIDRINPRVYDTVNNGVYKCGFATTQEAYEKAFHPLFESLDWLEGLLGERRYLTGDRITEADWRLFTTLVRFDPVYVGHFKCNRNRIFDMPNLWNYTLELYQHPGVAETINLGHIRNHYYASHETINPTRIVPQGPAIDYDAPHDRGERRLAA